MTWRFVTLHGKAYVMSTHGYQLTALSASLSTDVPLFVLLYSGDAAHNHLNMCLLCSFSTSPLALSQNGVRQLKKVSINPRGILGPTPWYLFAFIVGQQPATTFSHNGHSVLGLQLQGAELTWFLRCFWQCIFPSEGQHATPQVNSGSETCSNAQRDAHTQTHINARAKTTNADHVKHDFLKRL